MGRDLKFSQIAIPLFGNDAKGVGKQTGKTLGMQKYSGLNLQTSRRLTTQCKELHKCHSKNGIKELGNWDRGFNPSGQNSVYSNLISNQGLSVRNFSHAQRRKISHNTFYSKKTNTKDPQWTTSPWKSEELVFLMLVRKRKPCINFHTLSSLHAKLWTKQNRFTALWVTSNDSEQFVFMILWQQSKNLE